ncbi:hypothetical protein KEM48_013912 [Puccinia striiformis f. sp. tritici PST-130]|nr:hypothetical protein Pst134EB_018119 [Puccinia striiformis f. sp. tritici]KAI9630416.1 hypothetical protein KEM48_013912 [Puccinia striiformis f. sp. tritici PST-130]
METEPDRRNEPDRNPGRKITETPKPEKKKKKKTPNRQPLKMSNSSDSLKKQYEELMKVVTEERGLRQQAEQEKQRLEGELAAARQAAATATAIPAPKKIPKLALPDKFDGTRGNKAENFANQINLHFMGNPEAF